MDIAITVTQEKSLVVVLPLLEACQRRHCIWSVFFTGNGVLAADDENIVALLREHQHVHVCQESWTELRGTTNCPLTLGSQTNHSENMATAARIVSL